MAKFCGGIKLDSSGEYGLHEVGGVITKVSVKNKGFEIDWDGDTTGLVQAGEGFYKVSDLTPTIAKGEKIKCTLSTGEINFVPVQIGTTEGGQQYYFTELCLITPEPMEIEGTLKFSEAGVYFLSVSGLFVKQISCGVITEKAYTSCGQLWDSNYFAIDKLNGRTVVTYNQSPLSYEEYTILPPLKANCGLLLDARYFNSSPIGFYFVEKNLLQLKINISNATVRVSNGELDIQPFQGTLLYPVFNLNGENLTVTASAEGYATQTNTYSIQENTIKEITLLIDADK